MNVEDVAAVREQLERAAELVGDVQVGRRALLLIEIGIGTLRSRNGLTLVAATVPLERKRHGIPRNREAVIEALGNQPGKISRAIALQLQLGGIGKDRDVASPATERLERLLLDSPDNFVLAQLRGASYFTVARNVRPADAIDGYNGPLWNLVRVDEPQVDENRRALSTWRIYYINVQTGLPDRVEYQLNGKEIRAEFLDWTDQQGDKTPSYVRWTSDGQIVMEYRATTVSHN